MLFLKSTNSVQNPGDSIEIPRTLPSTQVDYEGELAIVIGRACRNATRSNAFSHILGYTCANDVSARDWQFQRSGGQFSQGKSFDTFCPLGPVIATPDEFPAGFGYHMQTLVNGEVMQSSTQEDLVFGPAQMLAYYSNFHIFEPGDIISMGSPSGVGMSRRPQIFLKPGDIVEVRVPEIGTLTNRIAL